MISFKHFFIPVTFNSELLVQLQNLTFELGNFISSGDIVIAVTVVFHEVFAKGLCVSIKMIIGLRYLVEFLSGGVEAVRSINSPSVILKSSLIILPYLVIMEVPVIRSG